MLYVGKMRLFMNIIISLYIRNWGQWQKGAVTTVLFFFEIRNKGFIEKNGKYTKEQKRDKKSPERRKQRKKITKSP